MTRLIDSDRLLTDRMKSKYYHLPNGDTAIPIIDIENAPTIDAVQVVRCGECKYVGYDATTYLVCNRKGMGLKPYHVYHDDYCSYGERREDGEA